MADSSLHLPLYRPVTYASHVQCPLLLCVGERDTSDSPQSAIKAAEAAPLGEVLRYDCDHYDFYVGENFEQTVADQCAFLVQHLVAPLSRITRPRLALRCW